MQFFSRLLRDEKEMDRISKSFTVSDDVIEYEDSIIQLRNVERVSLRDPDKMKFGKILLFSVIGLIISSQIKWLGLLTFILILWIILYIFLIVQYNQNLGKIIYIDLCSGNYLAISFQEEDFAKKIVEMIKTHIESHSNKTFSVNILDSKIVVGNNNAIIEDSIVMDNEKKDI